MAGFGIIYTNESLSGYLEAVCGAALEGDPGYEPDVSYGGMSGPALLFGYRYGIKARWRDKQIRWLCGRAYGECWRQSLLLPSHRFVIIAEGETDTISALSLRLEESGDTLAVGLAGASIYPNPRPFARKLIVIATDPDEAGEKSAVELRRRFDGIAREARRLSLKKEVCNG